MANNKNNNKKRNNNKKPKSKATKVVATEANGGGAFNYVNMTRADHQRVMDKGIRAFQLIPDAELERLGMPSKTNKNNGADILNRSFQRYPAAVDSFFRKETVVARIAATKKADGFLVASRTLADNHNAEIPANFPPRRPSPKTAETPASLAASSKNASAASSPSLSAAAAMPVVVVATPAEISEAAASYQAKQAELKAERATAMAMARAESEDQEEARLAAKAEKKREAKKAAAARKKSHVPPTAQSTVRASLTALGRGGSASWSSGGRQEGEEERPRLKQPQVPKLHAVRQRLQLYAEKARKQLASEKEKKAQPSLSSAPVASPFSSAANFNSGASNANANPMPTLSPADVELQKMEIRRIEIAFEEAKRKEQVIRAQMELKELQKAYAQQKELEKLLDVAATAKMALEPGASGESVYAMAAMDDDCYAPPPYHHSNVSVHCPTIVGEEEKAAKAGKGKIEEGKTEEGKTEKGKTEEGKTEEGKQLPKDESKEKKETQVSKQPASQWSVSDVVAWASQFSALGSGGGLAALKDNAVNGHTLLNLDVELATMLGFSPFQAALMVKAICTLSAAPQPSAPPPSSPSSGSSSHSNTPAPALLSDRRLNGWDRSVNGGFKSKGKKKAGAPTNKQLKKRARAREVFLRQWQESSGIRAQCVPGQAGALFVDLFGVTAAKPIGRLLGFVDRVVCKEGGLTFGCVKLDPTTYIPFEWASFDQLALDLNQQRGNNVGGPLFLQKLQKNDQVAVYLAQEYLVTPDGQPFLRVSNRCTEIQTATDSQL